MARQIVVNIVGDASKFSDATSGAIKSAEGLQGKLGSIGTGIAQGFGQQITRIGTDALGSVVGFVQGSIQSASDLNESFSKMQVVFGDNADEIDAWSKTSASAMGISRQAALEAAGTFGNLFTAMQIGAPQSAEMSKGLVQLASDLASFNNANPADVLEALRSGLTGETEPLKKFGVNINEATLKAKAMEMGLWDGKGALDAGAKAQASYALILEQTTTAQGDFARTSDGLANKQRIADAKMADLSATIGTKLLPVFVAVEGFIVDQVIPALEGIFDAISPIISGIVDGLTPVVQALVPVFQAVFAVLTPIVKGLGAAFKVVGGVISGAIKVISGVLAGAFKVWEAEFKVVGFAVGVLGNIFRGIGTVVSAVFSTVSGIVKGAINGVIGIINGVIGAIDAIQVHIHVGPVNLDWNGLNIPRIPRLHSGGIVPGAPGSEQLTVLQAGERVLPAGANAGGNTFIFNIESFVGTERHIDELAAKVALRVRLLHA